MGDDWEGADAWLEENHQLGADDLTAILAADLPGQISNEITFRGDGVTVLLDGKVDKNRHWRTRTTFRPIASSAHGDFTFVSGSLQGTGLGRTIMRNRRDAGLTLGFSKIHVRVDGPGAYFCVRCGFIPMQEYWPGLRQKLLQRLADLEARLGLADELEVLRLAMQQGPAVIVSSIAERTLLLHASDTPTLIPVGRLLLAAKGFSWRGELDLHNIERMQWLDRYVRESEI